jgi:hypothetical protein
VKSLSQHNASKGVSVTASQSGWPWRAAGVACDKCGDELLVDASVTYTSNPPKYQVWCRNCHFKGYML